MMLPNMEIVFAQSKFDTINDWKLPTNGQALLLFIGLVNFYHIYAPHFKVKMNPLCRFLIVFCKNPIPLMDWTPALIYLFDELKKGVTSSPVLAVFVPDKIDLIKTD